MEKAKKILIEGGIELDPIEYLKQRVEEWRRMRERYLQHIRRPPTLLPVFVSRTGHQEAMVHRYAGDGESFQVTYWDVQGPVGDTVTKNLLYIVEDLIAAGFKPTNSPRWVK